VKRGPIELAFVHKLSPFNFGEADPPPMISVLEYRNDDDGHSTSMIAPFLDHSERVGNVRIDVDWSEHPREVIRVRVFESECDATHERHDPAAQGAPLWAWMSTVGISNLSYGHAHTKLYELALWQHQGETKLRVSGFEHGSRFATMLPIRDAARLDFAFGQIRLVVEQVLDAQVVTDPEFEAASPRDVHLRIRQESWSPLRQWPSPPGLRAPSEPSCGPSTVPCAATVERPMPTQPTRLWLDETGTRQIVLHDEAGDIASLELRRDTRSGPSVSVAIQSERFLNRWMSWSVDGGSLAPRIDLGPAIVEMIYEGNEDAPARIELAWLPHAVARR
jgi:hypothetical protein